MHPLFKTRKITQTFTLFLQYITVQSAASQTELWGGHGPRFAPGTGGPEAGTTKPPHISCKLSTARLSVLQKLQYSNVRHRRPNSLANLEISNSRLRGLSASTASIRESFVSYPQNITVIEPQQHPSESFVSYPQNITVIEPQLSQGQQTQKAGSAHKYVL